MKKHTTKNQAEDINKHFFRHTKGQQAHQTIPNITNYLGNANQNHNEVSPPIGQMVIIKKSTINKW